jgi:two-component system chemotaxis response regulator CheY
MAKILIVDDSVFTCNLIRKFVEDGGHKVIGVAENGEKALRLYKSLQPEVVTLDYLMPDKNGAEVLKEIIQQDAKARVIMISGSGDQEIGEKVLEFGAMLYVEKSNLQRDILKAIDYVMEV